jgi:hypothetical protein
MPRFVQIAIRRMVARRIRARSAAVWPVSPAAGCRPDRLVEWPQGKQFAVVLRHDVETSRGVDSIPHLLQVEAERRFRSAFYFVPERYRVSNEARSRVIEAGCEVGVHGLKHNGKEYWSREVFHETAAKINGYLQAWNAVGFASPSSHHHLDWLDELRIEYDTSTFDSDPFEPQPDPLPSIFPVMVSNGASGPGFVELPYTMPQDFTLFVILQEKSNEIWKQKLDWIAQRGGMVHVVVHPDYIDLPGRAPGRYRYPIGHYTDLLDHIATSYAGAYWNPLPREIAAFWRDLNGTPSGQQKKAY